MADGVKNFSSDTHGTEYAVLDDKMERYGRIEGTRSAYRSGPVFLVNLRVELSPPGYFSADHHHHHISIIQDCDNGVMKKVGPISLTIQFFAAF